MVVNCTAACLPRKESRALSYDYNNYDYDYPIDSSCVRLPNRPNRLTLASNYPIDVSTEKNVQDFTWRKCFRIRDC
ncbi:tRNA 5-methylaminomethyl-2-thiouridine biosynthesis bifunctional protein MnmC [Trichinella pseudospiralis]